MHRHFRIYKPQGYLSQFVTNQRSARKKKMLGDLFDFPEGTMSIGRLDENSEGLLLLTTNGKLSTLITRGNIEKEYFVQVDGEINEAAAMELKNGPEITVNGKKYKTLPGKIRILHKPPNLPNPEKPIRHERHGPTSWISVTITEGKFRQVRKMTAAVGFPTLRLVRIRIGEEWLGDQQPGEVREVTKFEI